MHTGFIRSFGSTNLPSPSRPLTDTTRSPPRASNDSSTECRVTCTRDTLHPSSRSVLGGGRAAPAGRTGGSSK
eukprot:scaffold263125_cov26-Tisochrysis_lutea.AAC.1